MVNYAEVDVARGFMTTPIQPSDEHNRGIKSGNFAVFNIHQ